MTKFAVILMVASLTTPALAQFNGNSYSLEQMQSDNNRVQLEQQQREIWDLERQQNRLRQQQQSESYQMAPLYVPPPRPRVRQ